MVQRHIRNNMGGRVRHRNIHGSCTNLLNVVIVLTILGLGSRYKLIENTVLEEQREPAETVPKKYVDDLFATTNTVPDNNNSIPLVKACLDTTIIKAGSRVFNLPSCGNSLPVSSVVPSPSVTENSDKNWDKVMERCNDFASYAKGNRSTEKLQLLHLRQALDDECWLDAVSTDISYDHRGAKDRIIDCDTGVIFPRQLVGFCQCGLLSGFNKSISYYFSGHTGSNQKRDWVQELFQKEPRADVVYNTAGRDVRKKTGTYDWLYYDKLRSSEFALAPDGEFVWTYRFLEALMCGSIPILDRRKVPKNVQEEGYHYCLIQEQGEKMDCPYINNPDSRRQAAIENWKNFVRRHTLVSEEW